ncbi:AraC family transcriptional regulator [Actinomadura barringtoniae]|uniref:AraC family transcriptional regulator n=1 Tax=Actinomadura barringtoniae TaxID=1427535 RepID=A0A939T0P5_9ACTN|nr:helix-turn-helix domain-containing protein [Actinomadura barringtoniae]MBO2445866.1 AraC family transcriptional regulator [Actinomadura barringtoniae]
MELIEDSQDLSGAPDRIVHMPDTATALVFRDGELVVVGPRTRAAYFAGKELEVCVKARLRPGVAGAVLDMPVRELVDGTIPLSALWGDAATDLERRLVRLGRDCESIRECLEESLAARLRPTDHARLARTAVSAVSALSGPGRLPELARSLAVSERQLRYVVTENVGVPPKAVARITRLRSALGARRHMDLAQLAATNGYYDQSHMTAEFRSMMGVPPGAFFAGRLPAPQPC